MERAAIFIVAVLCAGTLAGCDNKPVASAAPPPPPVTVRSRCKSRSPNGTNTPAGSRRWRPSRSAPGSPVSSIPSISRMARSSSRATCCSSSIRGPIKLAVEQAKADLERAKSKLEIATSDVERATPLVRNQTLTEREFDTRKSTQRDAAGAVGVRRGGAEAGRTQPRMDRSARADRRAHLRPARRCRQPDHRRPTGATLLTTIVSLDPIHFVFDGSEADFIHYLRLASRRRAAVVARRAEPGRRCSSPTSPTSAQRPHGFRRQRGQSRNRHDPRPRHLRQQGRPADAGFLRPAAAVTAASTTRC